MTIERFVFGPFAENTYIIYDYRKTCIIIDPGCTNSLEELQIKAFIEKNSLKPLLLLLTHGHIDHIAGLEFVAKTYNLKPYLNPRDTYFVEYMEQHALKYGMNIKTYTDALLSVDETTILSFGGIEIKILETPGHSPGSVCFLFDNTFLIGGDVLFREGVGRTDLYMSNFQDLQHTIQEKLYTLNDDIIVHPGHGVPTTIGHEKVYNPFIRSL